MNTQRIIRSVPLVNYCLVASDETTADEMVRYTLLCFVFMPGSNNRRRFIRRPLKGDWRDYIKKWFIFFVFFFDFIMKSL